jgi:hypothetical protein
MMAVLSAYSFLGRSLLRSGFAGQQESASRTTLYTFSKDVGAAGTISTATASQLVLTNAYDVTTTPTTTTTNTYTFNSSTGKLTRTVAVTVTATSVVTSTTTTLLTGIASLSFTYHDSGGNVTTATNAIKLVDIAFTTEAGSNLSGTLAKLPIQSARVLLRNKESPQV